MEMFTVKNGARPGQRNVFILFTSGRSTGVQPLQPAVKQLQGLGVTTYVIGTSVNVDRDEVTAVAPGDDDGVYVVDDASRIVNVIPKIIMEILNRDSIGRVERSMDVLGRFSLSFGYIYIIVGILCL